LKKTAVGGAAIWAAPTVLSVSPAAAGSPAPGCTLVPITVAAICGPPLWRVTTTFDASACPGAIAQLDAINGTAVEPDPGWCGPISARELVTEAPVAFRVDYTVTLRTACDGTILAGPVVIFHNATALCTPPGDDPGAPAPRGDARGIITVTFGDHSIEIPAGD
jgi:hypothetical protein